MNTRRTDILVRLSEENRMKVIKSVSVFFAAALFLAACNAEQSTQVDRSAPAANNPSVAEVAGDMGGYVNEDFDLRRVGDLLQRARTPQEFESYLNEPDGINNLDLNGDRYSDYISVDEFGGEDDYERGLSLYSSYGPDQRQDLGTINFYRDEPRYPGARVVLTGNDNIYGDNNFYEANWLEKSIGIISQLFSPNREPYRSPYYYDNYPSDYTAYNVVEQPNYQARVQQWSPEPVFIYTTTAPVYYSKIKAKSPNYGRQLSQIYGKLKKPSREQDEFFQKNPRKPFRAKDESNDGNDRDKDDRKGDADRREGGKADKSDKHDKGKADKGDKPKHGGKNKGKKP